MKPVSGWRTAGERLGLRYFVFVMRKNYVLTAAVNVNLRAIHIEIHRGAFNVPARSSLSPGAFPPGFAFFGSFPQGKIEGAPLSLINFHARAGNKAFIVNRIGDFGFVLGLLLLVLVNLELWCRLFVDGRAESDLADELRDLARAA